MARFLGGILLILTTGCQSGALFSGGWNDQGMTPEAEALAGARAAVKVEAQFGGLVRDERAERRMARVAAYLSEAAEQDFHACKFRLLGSERINALSLPGHVYLTKGMYDQLEDDAQLAAVMAHEFAHIANKDSFKPRCCDHAEALDREVTADCQGAQYLMAAGLPAGALVELIRLIEDEQPSGWADSRIEQITRVQHRACFEYAVAWAFR